MNWSPTECVAVNDIEIRKGDLFDWRADDSGDSSFPVDHVRVRIVGFDRAEVDDVPILLYRVEWPEELTDTGCYRMRAEQFLSHVKFVGREEDR